MDPEMNPAGTDAPAGEGMGAPEAAPEAAPAEAAPMGDAPAEETPAEGGAM